MSAVRTLLMNMGCLLDDGAFAQPSSGPSRIRDRHPWVGWSYTSLRSSSTMRRIPGHRADLVRVLSNRGLVAHRSSASYSALGEFLGDCRRDAGAAHENRRYLGPGHGGARGARPT